MDARRSALIFANNLLGAFMGLVALFLIGRTMDPAALGMVAFALALVGLGDVLANLGLRQAHVKRVSEGQDLADCFATFARLKLLLTAGSMVLMMGAILAWHRWQGFQDATTLAVLMAALVHFGLTQGRAVWVTTFTALRRSAQAERIALTDTLVRVVAVAFVAAVVAGMDGLTTLGSLPGRLVDALGLQGPAPRDDVALWLAGTYVAGAAGALLIAYLATRRDRFPKGRFDRDLARSYVRFAAPLAITAVAGVLANRMDAVMVGYFWSAGQVGFYYMAQRFAAVVAMIPIAVGTVFFPLISELARGRSREGVHEVAVSAQRLLLLAVLPVVLTFILLRQPLLHVLVGDAYQPAATTLALLAGQALLMSLTVVATSVVKGFDRPRVAATSGLLIMGSNAVLNVLLIPDSILGVPLFGGKAVGAALATVIAQGVGMIYIHVQTRGLVGRFILGPYVLRQLAAATVVGIIGWYALPHWPGGLDRIWDMLGANVLILAAYLSALVALREWTRRDWAFFLDLIDPRKMMHYIRYDIGGRK